MRLSPLAAFLLCTLSLIRCASTPAPAPPQAAAATPAAPGSITGVVIDKATRKLIPEFTVSTYAAQTGPEARRATPLGETPVRNRRGEFAVRGPESGMFALRITAPGYVPSIVAGSGAAPSRFTIELDRGITVLGNVTTSDQQPAAGVEVTYPLSGASLYGLEAEKIVTDERGQFKTTLAQGEITLKVAKPGFISEEVFYRVPEKDARVDVRLSAATSVRGTVRDDMGAPVPSARVRALWADRTGVIREAMSDEAGTYAIDSIRAGTHKFEISKGGYAPGSDPAVELPRSNDLDLTIPRGAIVTGTVTGAKEEEKPWIFISFGHGVMTGINLQSKYGMVGIPAGKTSVFAEYVAEGILRRSDIRAVELANGGRSEVNLNFGDAPVIRGKVMEGDQPVGRAVVTFTHEDAAYPVARAVTDESGTYQAVGLRPGTYRVGVDRRELQNESQVILSGTITLDLKVGPAAPRQDLPGASAQPSRT